MRTEKVLMACMDGVEREVSVPAPLPGLENPDGPCKKARHARMHFKPGLEKESTSAKRKAQRMRCWGP